MLDKVVDFKGLQILNHPPLDDHIANLGILKRFAKMKMTTPLKVPFNLVSTMPINPTAPLNKLARLTAFYPVQVLRISIIS